MSVRARETTSPPFPFSRALPGPRPPRRRGAAWSIPLIASIPDRRRGAGRRGEPDRALRTRRAGRRSRTAGTSRRSLPPPRDRGHHREAAHHHRAKRFARYRLRPLDQSLPGLRAWLLLLLRPAEPRASRACRPGLDFETKIFAKPSAPDLLKRSCGPRATSRRPSRMGSNTDPYQPLERTLPHHAADPRSARTGRTTRSAS